ncbi:MAG: DMT family transporter [Armatimonadetes bacterium]|nr:DMT family transporter [Armatimonadota bacterium]
MSVHSPASGRGTRVSAPVPAPNGQTWRGAPFLAASGLIFGWPPILIRFLAPHFGPVTQSFYRYLAAGAFLLAFGALTGHEWRLPRGGLRVLALPISILFVHQLCFMWGTYLVPAVTAALIAKTNVLFTAGLAYALLREERAVLRHPMFWAGAGLAVAGVLGVTEGNAEAATRTNPIGVGLLLLAALSWSLYAVLVKRVVGVVSPFALAAWAPLLACALFLPLALLPRSHPIAGHFGEVWSAPLWASTLLLTAGVVVIGIGNGCYYYAIRALGPSICSTVMLVTPLVTASFAPLVLHETLTLRQMAFGTLLLFGCFMLTRLGVRAAISGARASVQEGAAGKI